jgi:DNA-binding transcriptional regulator YhcF (GntR family)
MEVEIKDKRTIGWFRVDNEFIDVFARHLGATTTVVYMSLCRHTNNTTSQSFPSMRLIADENGISTRSVIRATNQLEKWGIIKVHRQKKEDGTRANNLYTLQDKRLWKKLWKTRLSDKLSRGNHVTKKTPPSDKSDKNHVTPEPHNNTRVNKTNITRLSNFVSIKELIN